MIKLYDWQEESAAAMQAALVAHGVVADASSTGTGKTVKALVVAKRLDKSVRVVCPKSVIPDWLSWGERIGVEIEALNYEQVRTGKTDFGSWAIAKKVFEWEIPTHSILIFDEAHKLSGMGTQQSLLGVAAKRQKIPTMLLSATLMGNPLKGYVLGFMLGLHNLHNFWTWARAHGVKQGAFGMIWMPKNKEAVMEKIRNDIGPRFTRIRKEDIVGFPENQVIPLNINADVSQEMEALDSYYGVEARQIVELAKVPSIAEKVDELADEEEMSVVVFVNFLATLNALKERFPEAGVIQGGQTSTARSTVINSFQENKTTVLLVMAQAGGTGLSLHDLNGRPRASIICPGYSAVEFLQVLGRIHRAGALSKALNFVMYASAVPVERRMRRALESKLNCLTALNDSDFYAPTNDPQGAENSSGPAPTILVGTHEDQHPGHDSEHPGEQSTGDNVLGGSDGGGTESVGQGESMSDAPTVTPEVVPAAVDHSQRAHSRNSPSKLKNKELCASYESDETREVHAVTLRGTAMHEALDSGDTSNLDEIEKELTALCDEHMAEDAAWAELSLKEVRLKTHEPSCEGTVDRIFLGPKGGPLTEARVRDYKMGWNPVDNPLHNPQAIAYTIGAFLKWPTLQEVNFQFLHARLNLIEDHTFTRADLPGLMLRVSTIVQRVEQLAGKEYNVVESNCLYCGNKATCAPLLKKTLTLASAVTPAEQLPLPADLKLDVINDPRDMAKLLNAASVLEDLIKQVRTMAFNMRMESGVEIPGYDLIERQAKREIQNPLAAWEVVKPLGVTQNQFLLACKVKITELAEAIRSQTPEGTTKDAFEKEVTDALIDAGALTRGASFHVLQKSRKKTKKVLPA